MANIARNRWDGSGTRNRRRRYYDTYYIIEYFPVLGETDYVWKGRTYRPRREDEWSLPTSKRFRTKRKAFAAFEQCPSGTRLWQYFYKKPVSRVFGRRGRNEMWEREYIKT